ncbi:MAG: sugar transferase [Acidimicrobiia bacterium]|nr:sugar transferase [Acidimicrobiia bacterium]
MLGAVTTEGPDLFAAADHGAAPASGRLPHRVAAATIVACDAVALLGALAVTGSTDRLGWLYLSLVLFVLAAASTYRVRMNLGALDEAPRLAAIVTIPLLMVAPVASDGTGTLLRQALASVIAIVLARSFAYGALRAARRRGLAERTLIAGSGHVGIELAQLIRAHPEYGLDLVGFVGAPFPNLPDPLLGDIEHLDEVVTRYRIRRVLIAFGPTRESELVGVLRTAVLHDVEVHVVPRFFEIGVAPRGPDVEDLWGIPVYRVRQAALRARAWRFKRALDVVIASIGVVVAAPVMAVAAVAIKVTTRGPVLFRQRRIGQHGREFEVLKFRTLPVGHVDDSWNASDSEYPTAVGRILRRLSIDELPQLWNVLHGDMSLVGPRPERGYLVEQFNDSVYGYSDRHRLPVGLTGWAQVHGLRGETSLRERARFDNQYIEHWSLWRDIVVMVRTTTALFRPSNDASEPEEAAQAVSSPASLALNGRGAASQTAAGGTASETA